MSIVVEGVSKRFGRITALEGVSLSARRGEAIALIGPNGAGKTTLLKLMAGILLPDEGSVLVNGYPAHTPKAKERVGFMTPQDRGVYWRVSALDNLVFFGTLYGMTLREARRRAREVLEAVGLWERAHDRVASFSTGMMRRLELARALMHDPDVLLLDEPTSGIDIDAKAVILKRISELGRERLVVIASHDPAEVGIATRVIHLNKTIIAESKAPKLLKVLVKGDVSALDGRFRVRPTGEGEAVVELGVDQFDEFAAVYASLGGRIKAVDMEVVVAYAQGGNARLQWRREGRRWDL